MHAPNAQPTTHSTFAAIDADITAHFTGYVGCHLRTVGVTLYRHNGRGDDDVIAACTLETSTTARAPYLDEHGRLCINGLILNIPASELRGVRQFMHDVGLPFELPAATGEAA